MTGIGKTTLVNHLVNDLDVQDTFHDGILWTYLGQSPNLLTKITSWSDALNSAELYSCSHLNEALSRLKILLKDKRILIIIDDVWNIEEIKIFQEARGRDCQMLITTRLPKVAHESPEASNSVCEIPLLSESESLELLRLVAGDAIVSNMGACKQLVASLQYLPLAIHVAGNLLRLETRMDWGIDEMLFELQDGVKIFGSSEFSWQGFPCKPLKNNPNKR